MESFTLIQGGVAAAKGFRATGVSAGIKGPGLDVALLLSDRPAVIAGMFTTNKIQAAPVKVCRACVAEGVARGVVVNSGVANACTGPQGMVDARAMAGMAARATGVAEDEMLVCSTGTIGLPLPMAKIEAGIGVAAGGLAADGGALAAKAIMTTDTVDKQVAVEFMVDGVAVRVGGMAKGAGMIEPNMATMLAFLTTDAAVAAGPLQACLKDAVSKSFNRISVDGDQSTNDSVLMFANGASGAPELAPGHPDWDRFAEAVNQVTMVLAMKLVSDGEGVTKVVTVTVNGARSDKDARKAARAVANSLLVKTSWYGGDPNWGRIMDAVGYSGAEVDEECVDIRYNALTAVSGGLKAPDTSLQDLEAVLAEPAFTIEIGLNLGEGSDTVYTCDCSEEYVRINSAYMT